MPCSTVTAIEKPNAPTVTEVGSEALPTSNRNPFDLDLSHLMHAEQANCFFTKIELT